MCLFAKSGEVRSSTLATAGPVSPISTLLCTADTLNNYPCVVYCTPYGHSDKFGLCLWNLVWFVSQLLINLLHID